MITLQSAVIANTISSIVTSSVSNTFGGISHTQHIHQGRSFVMNNTQSEELYVFFIQHMLSLGYVPENMVEDIADEYLDAIAQTLSRS